jgi:hypothetical protein
VEKEIKKGNKKFQNQKITEVPVKKKGDVLNIPLHEGNTELNKLKNFDFLAFRF